MQSELQILVNKVKTSTADDSDFSRLLELIRIDEQGKNSVDIQEQYDLHVETVEGYTAEEMNTMYGAILQQYNQHLQYGITTPAVHRVHLLRTAWFKYAAAVIILFSVCIYFWNTRKEKQKIIASTKVPAVKTDITPGYNRAMLTLSGGKKIELNNLGKETIKDGNLAINNINGQLIYDSERGSISPFEKGGSGDKHNAILHGGFTSYNTMSTPRAGQYQLTLSDGTKVFLNAASSITYPVAFNGKTREVFITGEAYFEISPNKSQPFIVKTISDKITVLGTSFNINAYSDEPSIKTSLIDGAIKVNNVTLQPGQAFTNGKASATNINHDIAWRYGKFNFEGLSFQQVMRMLGRWYDVDIIYEKGIPDIEIGGEMGKDLNLIQLLDGLKDLDIHYKVEGRKLIIKP
jgi:transmembrane sensor